MIALCVKKPFLLHHPRTHKSSQEQLQLLQLGWEAVDGACALQTPSCVAVPPAHSSCYILHHLNAVFTVDVFQRTLSAPQEKEGGIFGILSALQQASEALGGC